MFQASSRQRTVSKIMIHLALWCLLEGAQRSTGPETHRSKSLAERGFLRLEPVWSSEPMKRLHDRMATPMAERSVLRGKVAC